MIFVADHELGVLHVENSCSPARAFCSRASGTLKQRARQSASQRGPRRLFEPQRVVVRRESLRRVHIAPESERCGSTLDVNEVKK